MAQSRKEIYEELKQSIPVMKAKKKELIYNTYKDNIKDLQGLAAVQKIADEEDLCVENFEMITEIGIDTYEKLEEEYSKIEEGIVRYEDKLHNAIMTIYLFVDFEYQEQSNPDYLAEDGE